MTSIPKLEARRANANALSVAEAVRENDLNLLAFLRCEGKDPRSRSP
jgi:hypothetical protein